MITINIILFTSNVYAGRGCCSHHIGVDESRCTIDGRQICKDDYISNGNSCTCNPDYYDEEHLVDPEGYDETNPYSYSSNSSDNDYKEEKHENSTNDNDGSIEYKDEIAKKIYLYSSVSVMIFSFFAYIGSLITPKGGR